MLWGSLYVVSQFVLGKIPTFTVAMFRYLIAFIALSFISLKSKKEKKVSQEYKRMTVDKDRRTISWRAPSNQIKTTY